MAEFISSFTTGFGEVIKNNLPEILKGVKILEVFDGLIYYKYDGNSRDLEKIIYFNNTFFVLKTIKGKNLNFPQLVNGYCQQKHIFLINKGTFRIRFMLENQFAKVDKNLARKAEECTLRSSRLTVDRLNPQTEIWFCIRRENFAFCGELISKREFTEKNLNKGELRPEVAYLMCAFANLKGEETVAEPFSGYGSIPVQLVKNFKPAKLYVNDLDKEKVDSLKTKKQLMAENVEITCLNAFDCQNIPDKSVDVVITDPPWGFYEDIGDVNVFYRKMFAAFLRILKENGEMVILSARKENLLQVCQELKLTVNDRVDTLVNGKKAGLFKIFANGGE